MILIDLQKALDTINHNIFVEKLKCIGFSEKIIEWYRSYLDDRYFKVDVEDSFSDQAKLVCGTRLNFRPPYFFDLG